MTHFRLIDRVPRTPWRACSAGAARGAAGQANVRIEERGRYGHYFGTGPIGQTTVY